MEGIGTVVPAVSVADSGIVLNRIKSCGSNLFEPSQQISILSALLESVTANCLEKSASKAPRPMKEILVVLWTRPVSIVSEETGGNGVGVILSRSDEGRYGGRQVVGQIHIVRVPHGDEFTGWIGETDGGIPLLAQGSEPFLEGMEVPTIAGLLFVLASIIKDH